MTYQINLIFHYYNIANEQYKHYIMAEIQMTNSNHEIGYAIYPAFVINMDNTITYLSKNLLNDLSNYIHDESSIKTNQYILNNHSSFITWHRYATQKDIIDLKVNNYGFVDYDRNPRDSRYPQFDISNRFESLGKPISTTHYPYNNQLISDLVQDYAFVKMGSPEDEIKTLQIGLDMILDGLVDDYNHHYLINNPEIGLLIKIDDEKVASMYQFDQHGLISSGPNCGINLLLTKDLQVPPKARSYTIDYLISAQGNPDYGYMIMPRSSISKSELIQANSIGLIDPEYRGSLIGKVHNLSKSQPQIKKKGESIMQIVLPNLRNKWKIQRVSFLNKTERNTGGFGSTGN